MALKTTLPRSTTLAGQLFRVGDRDVLPYAWTARDYASMVSGPELAGSTRGHNGGSSIQQYRLIRPPASVLVLDFFGFSVGAPGRPGDVAQLHSRLGAALAEEAFVGWGQPNNPDPPLVPGNDWLAAVTPRGVVDPATGWGAPADPATFVGGRFVAVVDAELGYHAIEALGDAGRYAADLAALTPYLALFDGFHALIVNEGFTPTPGNEAFYAAAYAETAAQCGALAALGFEAVPPDYTTILGRLRAILKA